MKKDFLPKLIAQIMKRSETISTLGRKASPTWEAKMMAEQMANKAVSLIFTGLSFLICYIVTYPEALDKRFSEIRDKLNVMIDF